MAAPFFSIILCTRNRPELIGNILFSLKNQSFQDFEVVFSDNSDAKFIDKNLQILKSHDFRNIKYIKPKRTLNMHDHYNFAIEHAIGEYVGVLTDKSLLRKNALQTLFGALRKETFDILNYQHTGCLWYPRRLWKWISPGKRDVEAHELEIYSPKDELERRFSFQYHRSRSGKYYNFGKLFFGFYHKSLIHKIKKNYGKLFHPFSPDYTSTVLALSLSSEAAYHPKKIMFSINNYMGNGAKVATQACALEKFIKSCGVNFETAIAQLPIPQVYTLHNLCAYDYEILKRLGCNEYQLNMDNLASLVAEDLEHFPYKSVEERKKLESFFKTFCNENQINSSRKRNKNTNTFCTKASLIDLIIRFLIRGRKIQKVKGKLENFYATHHRNLKDLLDEELLSL